MLADATRWRYDPAKYAQQLQSRLVGSLVWWAKRFPEVAVGARIVRGHPVPALVEASSDAQLLVVGSRGQLVARGMITDSVSQRLLDRAQVPVAVVHLKRQDGTEAPTRGEPTGVA